MTFTRTSPSSENAQPLGWAFFLALCGLFFMPAAEAGSQLWNKAKAMGLAEHETWHRLLHIEEHAPIFSESSIIDADFFLSLQRLGCTTVEAKVILGTLC